MATPRHAGTPTAMQRENQILAELYGCLGDMYRWAEQARPLIEANARLKPKLNNPELVNHPKRAEYVATYETRELQIRALRHRSDPFLFAFMRLWPQLSEARRQHIMAVETGWPQDANTATLAHRVWAWMATSAFLWPSQNECPF